MKHSALMAAAAAVAASLVIAACGSSTSSAPAATTTTTSAAASSAPAATSAAASSAAAASSFLGCMVTDTGGINDKSFNQSAWAGMQAAASANPSIQVKYLQSTTQNDYVPNINTFLGEKCGEIGRAHV